MMKLRAKTIVRRLSAFALCASLSLSLVSAHAADAAHPTTAEETAVAADAVMASLPYGFLSASCETVVDSVGTTEDIQAAKDQLAEEARAAEEAAKAAAEAEAKAAAAAARLTTLRTAAVTPRAISKSSALKADSVIRENTKKLGSFRLSFYCPCATCNGRSDAKTKIGTRMAEGRTIAVDSRIIPLGSRVYIDGYGVFIAEDTGGAIKGNRIDVCVSSHSRAYGFNRVFGYYIEVSKSFADQVPEHYIRKQTLANCERYITQELKELEHLLWINNMRGACLWDSC